MAQDQPSVPGGRRGGPRERRPTATRILPARSSDASRGGAGSGPEADPTATPFAASRSAWSAAAARGSWSGCDQPVRRSAGLLLSACRRHAARSRRDAAPPAPAPIPSSPCRPLCRVRRCPGRCRLRRPPPRRRWLTPRVGSGRRDAKKRAPGGGAAVRRRARERGSPAVHAGAETRRSGGSGLRGSGRWSATSRLPTKTWRSHSSGSSPRAGDMGPRSTIAILFAAELFAASPVAADDERERAATAFDQGVSRFRRGDASGALAAWGGLPPHATRSSPPGQTTGRCTRGPPTRRSRGTWRGRARSRARGGPRSPAPSDACARGSRRSC
jgi:hypothetical protein